jgi:hypothetical protein
MVTPFSIRLLGLTQNTCQFVGLGDSLDIQGIYEQRLENAHLKASENFTELDAQIMSPPLSGPS